MADVVVVGGGVGGLAAALRLRAAGHAVRVLERRPTLGGKLDVRLRDGFTFDTGPSLLTLPGVLDELFRVAGTRLATEVDLTRLDPQIRYRWPDGSGFDACDDPEATSRAVDAFSPGAGAALRRFTAHGERIWSVSERTFLAGPMSGPLDLLRRMRSPRDLTAIDPARTLDAVARRTFSDPRLVQWAGRYATYSGSSPYRAPATLACIPAVEARQGVWYPAGGMGTLRDALVRVAERTGVELATGCDVERIEASGDRVRAVVTADGTTAPRRRGRGQRRRRAPLPRPPPRRPSADPHAPRRAVAVRVRRPGRRARHHARTGPPHRLVPGRRGPRVPPAGRRAGWSPTTRPSTPACRRSATPPRPHPATRAGSCSSTRRPARPSIAPPYQSRLFELLAAYGTDLRDRLCFTETITPADLAERYRAPGGAIYGTSSNGRRAAFLRPANRGPRRGLYLVGGSSHPGGGLPLVTISGRIVADLVGQDGW